MVFDHSPRPICNRCTPHGGRTSASAWWSARTGLLQRPLHRIARSRSSERLSLAGRGTARTVECSRIRSFRDTPEGGSQRTALGGRSCASVVPPPSDGASLRICLDPGHASSGSSAVPRLLSRARTGLSRHADAGLRRRQQPISPKVISGLSSQLLYIVLLHSFSSKLPWTSAPCVVPRVRRRGFGSRFAPGTRRHFAAQSSHGMCGLRDYA